MERQEETELSGKVAVITGASRGIGKHTALTLARRGANIVVAARTVDPDNVLPGTIGQTVADIESAGGKALAVAVDLSEEGDLANLVRAAVERFGGVDILINNAAVTRGHGWGAPLLEISRADWLYNFAVNVHAPFTLTQLVVPIMEARGGGRILNVTTGSGEAMRLPEEPPKREAAGSFNLIVPQYYSSKRALDRFANVIAPVLARKNIFIITMHPGMVASEIARHHVETGGLDDSRMVPMDVPARMLAYFAACKDPSEYTGRIFFAQRELADLGLEVDAS
jgi:NAD(P)-dependent dehydrogenase (short-subunit alcohol dehydrogenase family)